MLASAELLACAARMLSGALAMPLMALCTLLIRLALGATLTVSPMAGVPCSVNCSTVSSPSVMVTGIAWPLSTAGVLPVLVVTVPSRAVLVSE